MRSVMADLTAYPIIFSAPMVKALLDGRKSQTRRMAWRHSTRTEGVGLHILPSVWQKRHDKFQAGERPWLWVRESVIIAPPGWTDSPVNPRGPHRQEVGYAESDGTIEAARDYGLKQTPSIHMPKWASRLSLRVTGMRMERLMDISADDARAEGHPQRPDLSDDQKVHDEAAIDWFMDLWDSIHGRGKFTANPEIIVTTFDPHLQNIGSVT